MSTLSQWLRWSLEWDVQNVQGLLESLFSARPPRIYASNSPVGELARSVLYQKYWSPPLLGFVLQTSLSWFVLDAFVDPCYHRTNLTLKDGGIIGLDWYKWSECKALPSVAPILLVLHPITGHSRFGYIKSLCGAAYQHKWRPVAINLRGCDGLPLTTSRVYSALDTADVHAAVCHIEHLYPDAPIMLAGYSMGAMLLTKYIAELPSEPGHTGRKIVAAAAASSPFDLGAAWKCLGGASLLSLNFWMQYVIVIRWVHFAWKHWEQLSRVDGMQWSSIWKSRTMVDIDTHLTSKALGYSSVDQFYSDINSFQYIAKIRIPCLFPAAADDPFVWELPIEECRSNSQTVLAVTDLGGHCGHLQGLWPFGPTYLDNIIVSFFQAVLTDSAS